MSKNKALNMSKMRIRQLQKETFCPSRNFRSRMIRSGIKDINGLPPWSEAYRSAKASATNHQNVLTR